MTYCLSCQEYDTCNARVLGWINPVDDDKDCYYYPSRYIPPKKKFRRGRLKRHF